MTDDKKKRRSIEEITADIEQISQDPEHRDQFKALRMLAAEKATSVVLPDPMSDNEIIERIARLIKPVGRALSSIAYRRAFPYNKDIEDEMPKLAQTHLTPEEILTAKKCNNLKALYRTFPEIKRAGMPTGYPRGRSIEEKQEWCRDQATKILIGRAQARLKAVEKTDVGLPNAVTDDSGLPESDDNESR